MRNLLRAEVSDADLRRILDAHRDVSLLPVLGATEWREAFAKPAVQKWMMPLRELAERERDEPLPALTDELYAEFHRTGVRRNFEGVYFERRRRLARAALCALEQGETWFPSVIAKLQGVFEEVSWALPAHVSHGSGKDPARIDLFAAETANLMGEMLTLFEARLPSELARRVRARLHAQIFENYLAHEFEWMNAGMNWNAVCHQGVLGGALAVEEDGEMVARMLLRARERLPAFLRGFSSDGGSSEGPAYWEYGFGWFCELNRQLEQRTDGELSLIEGDAYVREIAKFGPRMTLSNRHLVNFSDCSHRGLLRPSLLQYLGERLDDAACRQLAWANFHQLAATGIDPHSHRSDLMCLTRLFLSCPSDLSNVVPIEREDVFLKDLAVIVVHGTDRHGNFWEFAAKGGHNDEHHNHNDCGSYILNINGERLIIELGAPEYVRDYFRPETRYSFLAARTLGHSLPVINGCEQQAGREFASTITEFRNTGEEIVLGIDLTRCYPPQAKCDQCLREFHLRKDAGELHVEDRFVLRDAHSLETAVITERPVTVINGGARMEGVRLAIEIAPDKGSRIETVEQHSYSSHGGKPAEVNRIVINPEKLERQAGISYRVRVIHRE